MNKLDKENKERLKKQIYGPLGAIAVTIKWAFIILAVCALTCWALTMNYINCILFVSFIAGLLSLRAVLIIVSRTMYAFFDWYAIALEWVKLPLNEYRYIKALKQIPAVSELERRKKALQAMKERHRPGFKPIIDRMIKLTDRFIESRKAQAEAIGRAAYEYDIQQRKQNEMLKKEATKRFTGVSQPNKDFTTQPPKENPKAGRIIGLDGKPLIK